MRNLLLCILISGIASAEPDFPIKKDSPAPFTGILISTDSYSKILKDASELASLQVQVSVLNELIKGKSLQYEDILKLKTKEIELWQKQAEKNAQRTVWDDVKFYVGFTIGAAVTILLVYGVNQASK